MDLDGYIRVSQVAGREGPSFISPTVQRETIEGWATRAGHTIIAWHEDLDRSGGTMSRPAFDAMMARLRDHRSAGVVVAKLDRFGRTLVGALGALTEIDSLGATFVSVAEQFDTSTPTGRLMMRVMLSLAEFERDRITESWATAQSRAIDRGVHMATPFGYARTDAGLVPDERNAPLVREAFARRARGDSMGLIADWLSESRTDGLRWADTTVAKILQNRAYLGEASHGDFLNPAAHVPLIASTVWHTVSRMRTSRVKRSRWLLSGFLRCAGCRYTMQASNTSCEPLYVCRRKYSGGLCKAPAVIPTGMAVDHILETVFARHAIHLQDMPDTSELTSALAAVAAAEDEYRAFALFAEAAQFPELLTEASAVRGAALVAARAVLAQVQTALSSDALPGIFALDDLWTDMTFDQRRRALTAMFDTAFVRKAARGSDAAGRVHICWPGEGPVDLPMQGRAPQPLRPFDWNKATAGVHLLGNSDQHVG